MDGKNSVREIEKDDNDNSVGTDRKKRLGNI